MQGFTTRKFYFFVVRERAALLFIPTPPPMSLLLPLSTHIPHRCILVRRTKPVRSRYPSRHPDVLTTKAANCLCHTTVSSTYSSAPPPPTTYSGVRSAIVQRLSTSTSDLTFVDPVGL